MKTAVCWLAFILGMLSIVSGGETNLAMNPTEGSLQVNGGKVWYRIAGTNRSGVPLLILHGGPGAPHDYLEPLEVLSDERPLVFYDQLGCGNSEHPTNASLWTAARFVEELGQVRSQLGLKTCHILGQSWGTMLAVDYLLTSHPTGVISLVLSGPCLSASRWEADQRAYLKEMPEETQKVIREAEASGNFDSPAYQDAIMQFYHRHVCRLEPWPDCFNRTLQKLAPSVYQQMWGPSEFTVTGALKTYERVARLNEIKLPVLFTCGRYDEATPAATELYHRHLPGSELLILESASHMHHLEQTELYCRKVRDFLRRAEGGKLRRKSAR